MLLLIFVTLLIDLAVSEKPILYPCGNLRQETLPKKLKESGSSTVSFSFFFF